MITFKHTLWTLSLAALTSLAIACGDDGGGNGDDDDDDPVDAAEEPDVDADPGITEVRVVDDITEDTTWTADHVYVLPRLRYVFVQPGATLTIEAGTRIEGEQGAVLVVTRGARIEAVGTPDAPIVFTSAEPNTPGYWGGVLVMGSAPINNNVNSDPPSTEATFEAFTSAIPEGKFGGTDADDDSGTLKYVRIEFGGFNFVADREFNNLTLAGVGSGTEIDYVQVHAGLDDGVELFGGTVNVKHIISSQNGDDGLDSDNGWQGNGQFIVIQNVRPQGSLEASNGYESDNHGTSASYAAAPRTLPTVSNVTMIGNRDYADGTSFATVWRRGTGGHYYNHIITDFPRGIEFRDQATKDQLDAGNLYFAQSLFFENGADGTSLPPPQGSGDIVEADYLDDAERDNSRTTDPMLTDGRSSLTGPVFQPSQVVECGPVPSGAFFDADATFCGAVGSVDWTVGWTAYPQPQ